jgi:hypothetical protein
MKKRSGSLIVLTLLLCGEVGAQSFVHPGLLQSREDLERMRKGVAEKQEPIYAGYQLFIQNPVSQDTFKMKGPMVSVGRNPTVGQGIYDNDANAAYQNALMWAITGKRSYADKAKEIINAWSSTLTSITGRDAVLMAGLGPFKMVNAAEILRYTDAGWAEADVRQAEKHFMTVVYPVLKDFAPFANGNWDAAAIKTVLSIGVFCNNRELFERALRYYVNGGGNGRLTNYIINEEGQVQESGRDQQHTQLGIGLLGDCSEIAWHQGLDLYAYADNRLLKGFEYTAKYNLGNEVPFVPDLDRTGKYAHTVISMKGRGQLRAVYEQIYNHYVNRRGLAAPYTQEAAEKIRPEGPGRPGADHPGYGTLLYSRPAVRFVPGNEVPAAPAAITATGSAGGIQLAWIASVQAERYTIKRGLRSGGPYRVIARNVRGPKYTDGRVKSGIVYYYTISAGNGKGESADAVETGIAAGLPMGWKQRDIGAVDIAGRVDFDGKKFRVEAAGRMSGGAVDSVRDAFHYIYASLAGDGGMRIRFDPEPSSQFSSMGIMMRSSIGEKAAFVGLMVNPGKGSSMEAPAWNVQLTNKEAVLLPAPIVTYGRLTGACWLRLERKGDVFTGYYSVDGVKWVLVGSVSASLGNKLLIGVPVASGILHRTTTVFFSVVQM